MTTESGFTLFSVQTRPALRKELEAVIAQAGDHATPELQEMISYQMGWSGEGAGEKAEGKQIRPLLALLSCQAAGGDWENALPAAAAVELIHNFSLIHDDIEDNGEVRRGRPTVWKIWGKAQAINTGDAMFALANLALLRLEKTTSLEITLEAARLFHQTCLRLTQGQHLDMAFEEQEDVLLEEYWKMVSGKTAALLAFSLEVGALSAGAGPEIQSAYRDFGNYLGMAFQVQDDILGIWGAEEQIGKSTTGDLVTRKKTLPVIYGLSQKKSFYQVWTKEEITPENAPGLSELLESEGGRAYAQTAADRLTGQALGALEAAKPGGEAGKIIAELAEKLLKRQA